MLPWNRLGYLIRFARPYDQLISQKRVNEQINRRSQQSNNNKRVCHIAKSLTILKESGVIVRFHKNQNLRMPHQLIAIPIINDLTKIQNVLKIKSKTFGNMTHTTTTSLFHDGWVV